MTKRSKILSVEEERALFDRYLDEGDIRARNELILAYRPLAVTAAKAFAMRGTVPLEDLCQEAYIALAQAVEKFDRDKGVRLSTFGAFYMRAALMKYIMNNSGVVRVGTNFSDKKVFANLRRMTSEIEARTGKPIDDEGRQEIADALKVDIGVIKRMEARVFDADVSVDSVDSPRDDNGAGAVPVHENLSEPSHETEVAANIDAARLTEYIASVVEASYSGRDLHIVQERLKGDMTPERYRALIDRYGITVERIRQIQRQGLATVREALVGRGIDGMSKVTLTVAN